MLTGINRKFGVGETKSQNAVIKVYTADELKNALSKLYLLPNGVGTIEIAGDITITEPIKLKYFSATSYGPRQIVIQSVGGAKILNGNTTYSNTYDWGTGYTNSPIPVFDFGICSTSATDYPICTYTFKNLIINSADAFAFKAICAFNALSYSVNRIEMDNIQINNCWSIVSGYTQTGVYTAPTIAGSCIFNNIHYISKSTVASASGNLDINNELIHFKNCLFANIDTNIPNVDASEGSTTGYGFIVSLYRNSTTGTKPLQNNIFQNIATLALYQTPNGLDNGNTVINCSIINVNQSGYNAFTFINCDFISYSGVQGSTPLTGPNTLTGGYSTTSTDTTSTSNATEGTWTVSNVYSNLTTTQTISSGKFLTGDNVGVTYSELDVIVNVKAVGGSNHYHFKLDLNTNGYAGANGTVLNKTTISAFEQTPTTTINFTTPFTRPTMTIQDSTGLQLVAITFKVNGINVT